MYTTEYYDLEIRNLKAKINQLEIEVAILEGEVENWKEMYHDLDVEMDELRKEGQ